MRHFFLFVFFLNWHFAYSQTEPEFVNSQIDSLKSTIKTELKLPFGTITKLEVQIFDGNLLQTKESEGVYLFKIISINGILQTDTLLMTFMDETKSFAKDNFELYKLLYKKEIGTLSQKDIVRMKKAYVDKKYKIMAYETGQFLGIPKNYFKYQPVRADLNFHFKNYLIVVSNMTEFRMLENE